MTRHAVVARIGARMALLAIIILSVVPGSLRPHLLGNDRSEHFVAYFVAGSLLAVGPLRRAQLLTSGILLPACAGLIEIAQLWIPGRTPSVGDFAVSALGAWIGQLVVSFIRQARHPSPPATGR